MITPQEKRDAQFLMKVTEAAKRFKEKNTIFQDAFLTSNDTLEECSEEIRRQFEKIQSKVKYANAHLNIPSLQHDLRDLLVYTVLTQIWLDEHGPQYEKESV